MRRAEEAGQPVINAVHLADDIRAGSQVEIDIAGPGEKIGKGVGNEARGVMIKPGRGAESGAVNCGKQAPGLGNAGAIGCTRRDRAVIESAAQAGIGTGVETGSGCFLGGAAQECGGKVLQQGSVVDVGRRGGTARHADERGSRSPKTESAAVQHGMRVFIRPPPSEAAPLPLPDRVSNGFRIDLPKRVKAGHGRRGPDKMRGQEWTTHSNCTT